MSEWLIGLGLVLVIVGLILISPLSDLLPVDIWYSMKNMLSSSTEYVRIVPTEEINLFNFVPICIGLAFTVAGFYFKKDR